MEFDSKKTNLSIVAGGGLRRMQLDVPSEYIPFEGDFPILKPHEWHEYQRLAESNMYVEDLTFEQQRKFMCGFDIDCLEKRFLDYLKGFEQIARHDFLKLPTAGKLFYIAEWMDRCSIDKEWLTINY